MLKVKVYRGMNQIGGSIIQISSKTTNIVFDVGLELNKKESMIPAIEGLFTGKRQMDAVILSHYHADHIGLLNNILQGIPAYMGRKSFDVFSASCKYREMEIVNIPLFFETQTTFMIGDIKLTPYLCDHSAFDSYMFLVENENQKILYTGDFRANGRKNFDWLLKQLPQTDVLIVEGTTLARKGSERNVRETDLEEDFEKYLTQHNGPAFVLMSAMNIDRLVTAYKGSIKSKRIFLEDLYTAGIAVAAGENIPNPIKFDNVRVFMSYGDDKKHDLLNEYGNAKIGIHSIAKKRYTMCIRPSMKNYLEKLSGLESFNDGILIYSMWKGYQEKEEISHFLEFMRNKGVRVVELHTTGHADEATIEALINTIKPKAIIPVHTENAEWFDKYSMHLEIVKKNEFVLE